MRRYTRREVLEMTSAATIGGVLVAGGCAGQTGDEPPPNDGAELTDALPEYVPEDARLFPAGIQAGAMTSTSVLLKTHTVGPVRLMLWRPAEDPSTVWLVRDELLTPTLGVVSARITGLGPAHYLYTFVSVDAEARSPIGQFRTAFAKNDARLLRIAALTCTSLRKRPFVALDLASEESPDLLLHMGDMSYNDEATTLSAYRDKWRTTLAEPEYQRVFRTTGYYLTWDDHEIDNNYDPEKMAVEQPDRLNAAKEAYFEALAVDRGENDRIWRSYRWGTTAEIFVVDSRSERRPSTRGTDNPVYIGEAQMAWLKKSLANSPCKFKLVMNSVPMTRMAEIWQFGQADTWLGYGAQRQSLIDHMLDEEIDGVVFLSGDFHCGFVGRIEPKGDARRFYEIAVGPTGNGPNPLPALAESGDLPAEEIFPSDQFEYYSSTDSAMTFLELDPTAERLFVRFVDARPGRYGDLLYASEIDPFIR